MLNLGGALREKCQKTAKYGPEITLHLDTFHAVVLIPKLTKGNNDFFKKQQGF